ncbi:MAG: hypothetical protein E2598_07630 [Sphingobium sp.]|nr:hypothetical protein [Sphingobium sp.]
MANIRDRMKIVPWVRQCAGDWRAENDFAPYVTYTGIGPTDSDKLVALAISTEHDGGSEFEDNIKLLTAAPQMRAALIDLRRRFLNAVIHSGTDPDLALEAVKPATDAIIAAGGELL